MEIEDLIEIQHLKLLDHIDTLTGLFAIMVYLHRFDEGNMTAFINEIGLNQQPTTRTLERLMELGLIEQKEVPAKRGGFNSKMYYLTEEGEELSPHFWKICEALAQIVD